MENKELATKVADHYEITMEPWTKSTDGTHAITSKCHLYYGGEEINTESWAIGPNVPIELEISFKKNGILAIKPHESVKKIKRLTFKILAKNKDLTLASKIVEVSFRRLRHA